MQAIWMCQYGFHASHLAQAMVFGRDVEEALVRFCSLCWHTRHAGIMMLAGDAEGLVPSSIMCNASLPGLVQGMHGLSRGGGRSLNVDLALRM